jgi:ribosomal protein S18 acetylase RimI-like enzyme
MELVKATMNDVDSLIVFFHEAWEESDPDHLGFTAATEETINEIASEEFLKKRLSNPDVSIYVVKDNDRVVGFASTRNINLDAVELSGIIVLESASGKGFGTRLIEEAISEAGKAGFHRIVVKTEVANERAINLYNKMGFAKVGEARENVEDTPVEIVVLERPL